MSAPFIKIKKLDEHIVAAASGIVTDAKTIVEYARVEAQVDKFHFCILF